MLGTSFNSLALQSHEAHALFLSESKHRCTTLHRDWLALAFIANTRLITATWMIISVTILAMRANVPVRTVQEVSLAVDITLMIVSHVSLEGIARGMKALNERDVSECDRLADVYSQGENKDLDELSARLDSLNPVQCFDVLDRLCSACSP